MFDTDTGKAVFLVAVMVISVVAIGAGGVSGQSSTTGDAVETGIEPDVSIQSNATADNGDVTSGPSVSAEPQQVEIADGLRDKSGETVLLLQVERGLDRDDARAGVTANALKTDSDATLTPVANTVDTFEGADVRNQFWVGNVVSVTANLEKHDIEDFAAIDGVVSVAPNLEVSHPEPPEGDSEVSVEETGDVTYGLEQIDVPGFEDRFNDRGGNASVAIIDDGISNPEEGHPDLEFTQTAVATDGEVQEGTLGDAGSHGEHVAGTATGAADPAGDVPRYGVAPNASLTMINVFQGQAAVEDMLAATQYAAEQDIDVASMSLGLSSQTGNSVLLNAMESAIQDANDAGTLVIGSAGNAGSGDAGGPVTSPGAEFSGFSIGNSNSNGNINAGSSGAVVDPHSVEYGDTANYPSHYPRTYVKPDVSAPGTQVLSAGPVGTIVEDEAATYSIATGTSMAAPHVAGAATLIQSATSEDVSPELIKSALAETAEKDANDYPAHHNRDIRYGTGIINVTAATMAIEDGTMQPEGTVTDTDGESIPGASISADSGALTSTNESGAFDLATTGDSVDVTADAFGYEASTQTIDPDAAPVDFELADQLAVDVIDDQNAYVEFGGHVNMTADVRNLGNLTVELSDATNVSPDDLTPSINGENVTFGAAHDLGGHDGEVTVRVDIADDAAVAEGDQLELDLTYEGLGDTETRSTGESTLTEELEPAFYELSNLDVPDGIVAGAAVPATVEITNTGQVTPSNKGVQFLASHDGTQISLPPEAVTIAPDETSTYEVQAAGIESFFGPGDLVDIGFQTGDITSSILGDSIAEEDVEETISSDMALQSAGVEFQAALDGPIEASAGEKIAVDATIQNAGNENGTQEVTFSMNDEPVANETVDLEAFTAGEADASTELEFNTTLPAESGVSTYSVSTENETATNGVGVDTNVPQVTVVSASGHEYGAATVDLLERGLGLNNQPTYVSYADVGNVTDETIANTDVFVFHDFGDDTSLIETVEEDPFTTAVYLEQFADSNAIADRSDVLNDPETSMAAFGDGTPVEFEVVEDHALFEGVGMAGDRIPIHTAGDADRAYFTGADGETLAEVGVPGQANEGPVATVDPDSGSVLIGSIAPNSYESESDFTDPAAKILANSVSVAQDGISTDGVASTAIDTDFVGVVDDANDVTLEAQGVAADNEPVDGETVTFTIGEEPVATATVEDGHAEADVDPATLGLEAGEEVSVGVEELNVASEASVETVHETRDLSEGFNLLSVPQVASLSSEDVNAFNTWNTENETYDQVTQSTFDSAEDLNDGLYVSAESDDARLGFTFDDEVPTASTDELAEGWTLTGSNFPVDSVEDGDERTLEEDLIDVDPSAVSVFSTDFNQQYDGQQDIGGYDAYWTYNGEAESAERPIISPAYEVADREEVLGDDASNFSVSAVDVTGPASGDGAIEAEVTVENDGGVDTQFVDLMVDSEQDGTFERADRSHGQTLDTGETATVTLNYTPSEDDSPDVDLKVATEDDESATETVDFEGSQFNVSVNEADSTFNVSDGDDATVNATVDNNGDLDATKTVDLVVNESVVASEEVALDVDESATIDLSFETSQEAHDEETAMIESDDDSAESGTAFNVTAD